MKSQSISFIGSGNVATHLALACHAAGHRIVQIYSRNLSHAATLAQQVGATPIHHIEQLGADVDMVIVAVSDDAIYTLASQLQLPDVLVMHTSGTTPMEVLAPVSKQHGVLWAPQTFVRTASMDYASLPFCIEGSTLETTDHMVQLAQSISSHTYLINSAQRRWLHLASVLVNNFCHALHASAQQLLDEQQIPFDILYPLIDATAAQAHHEQLAQLQTGPAKRHDDKTLDAQRQLLANQPQLLELYNLMTQLIQSSDTTL